MIKHYKMPMIKAEAIIDTDYENIVYVRFDDNPWESDVTSDNFINFLEKYSFQEISKSDLFTILL